MYKCGKCGTLVEDVSTEVRCPNCAYKIVYKLRSPVTKPVVSR